MGIQAVIDVDQIAQKIAREGRPLAVYFGPIRRDGSREYLPDGTSLGGYHFMKLERRLRELGARVDVLDADARRRNTLRGRASVKRT